MEIVFMFSLYNTFVEQNQINFVNKKKKANSLMSLLII